MSEIERILTRAEAVLEWIETWLDPAPAAPPWEQAVAFRWRRRGPRTWLQPLSHIDPVDLDDLLCVDHAKAEAERNTRQFVETRPANNMLLWGARGTGKSSLVKALLNRYQDRGLRLIEVGKDQLIDLPDVVDVLGGRSERFIIYCDDLSFGADEPGYKTLKAVLEGSASAIPSNVLLYATSNRRHLMPERMADNLEARNVEGEIHPGESVEEQLSLSDRFGLWLSFYPFKDREYLAIVDHWVRVHGADPEQDRPRLEREALQWARGRGSRSGRTAMQFARDWAGRQAASH